MAMGAGESGAKKGPESSTPAPPSGAGGAGGQPVRLNVYSPTGGQHAVYHTGLEVLGAEYVFGGGDTSFSGVTAQRPRVPPPGSGWNFYQTVDLGATRASRDEILRIITELRGEFPASGYDLMSRNCNHFSDALSKRLLGGTGIPGWVNRLAGLGDTVRSTVSGGGSAAAGKPAAKAEGGAGGPAATGLVARSTPTDGDLTTEVDWSGVGVLNAREADPAEALRAQGLVSSEEGSGELLLLLPFQAPVKLQAVRLEAPNAECAPSRVRLFANKRDLDVDDAAGGVAATQEFLSLTWEATGSSVSTKLDVNFLKFQNLGFLAIYFGRLEEEDADAPISAQGLRLLGRV